jgi:hypothetical protein
MRIRLDPPALTPDTDLASLNTVKGGSPAASVAPGAVATSPGLIRLGRLDGALEAISHLGGARADGLGMGARDARAHRLDCALAASAAPALVAQWIEHLTTDQKVGGSSPSERTGKVQLKDYFP